jgi:hypothetical protein
MPRITNLQIRRGTSSEWSTANPTLNSGEPGLDTTLNVLKIGNGTATWANLSVINSTLATLNVGNLNLTSSNIISTGTNSSIILFPNGSGNVGISTNSPNAKFHVYSPRSNDTILNIEGTNGSLFSVTDNLTGSLMSVNNNSGLPILEVFSDDKVIAGRFNKNDFVLVSTGNVGIGTNSASEKLEVTGNVRLTNETSSTITHFDSNKNLKSLPTSSYPSLTELSYVKGVTSAIQTQINNLGTSYQLSRTTTDATANVSLTTDGNAPSGTTNLVVVSASSVWIFTANITCYNTTDNAMGAFQIRGAISRNGSNTTNIIGSTIREYFLDSSMASVTANVVADDSNETIQVRVQGLTSKTIKWNAAIRVEEISTA